MPGMQMPCPEQQPPMRPPRHGNMEGMDHQHVAGVHRTMNEQPKSLVEAITQHGTSGTSAEPNSTPTPMLMTSWGKWMLMFHGEACLKKCLRTLK